MWSQIASAALGVWLLASPAVLAYGAPASNVSWIVGPIAASFAFIAAFEIGRPLRWLNVPLGAALVVAPAALDYDAAAFANSVAVGLALVALALATRPSGDAYGGGWSSLFR